MSDARDIREEDKLIKVIMIYEDGHFEYIEGDDVEKWKNALNSALILDLTHGGGAQEILKDIIWKKVPEEKNRKSGAESITSS